MKELMKVRDTVVNALQHAGVTAVEAFPPQQAKRCDRAVAAVAVGAAEGGALGFCNYLGETVDPKTGAIREVYGKQLDGEITVEIRAGQAAECEKGCEMAAEVLLEGLPAGIRPGELKWEPILWERQTGLFLRRGTLRCRAVFVARAQDEGETFLDFILKGVMEH